LKISIVIPAFNEERLIAPTLSRIQAATRALLERGWEAELIVCDNNSSDRTGELARAAGATVVFEPINQIARARNRGAAAATGDWLLFIDADSHPSRELLGEVADAISTGLCLAGGCTLVLDARHPFGDLVVRLWNAVSRAGKLVAGSFIFCDAAAFRELGGFSYELFAGEELDLSKRLKRLARERGKKLVILHRYPLVTSARKMRLYTPREHLSFFLRTVFGGGKTLNSREACHTWYDGRR